jgi:hypothetical protein
MRVEEIPGVTLMLAASYYLPLALLFLPLALLFPTSSQCTLCMSSYGPEHLQSPRSSNREKREREGGEGETCSVHRTWPPKLFEAWGNVNSPPGPLHTLDVCKCIAISPCAHVCRRSLWGLWDRRSLGGLHNLRFNLPWYGSLLALLWRLHFRLHWLELLVTFLVRSVLVNDLFVTGTTAGAHCVAVPISLAIVIFCV